MNDVIYEGDVSDTVSPLNFLVTKEVNGYALWRTILYAETEFTEVFMKWFHVTERDEALETAVQLTVEARAKLDEAKEEREVRQIMEGM